MLWQYHLGDIVFLSGSIAVRGFSFYIGVFRRESGVTALKLLRKINNNAAVAQDKRGREMVVLGKGVGFHTMPYELTDLSIVYRTFYDVDPQYYDIVSSLPEEALMAGADIVEQAEITLNIELNPNLPFTLADHISFALQREKQGIQLATPLNYDVRHLYPREYELGLRALEIVRLRTGSSLPRAEAVSIALYLVNAELEGSDLHSTLTAVEVLDDVTSIVEQKLGVTLDRESYNYARFAMHIQFLVRRLSSGAPMEQGSGGMLDELSASYPQVYACARDVAQSIEQKYGWHCSRDEVLYLMLHIYRVQSRDDG